MALTPAAGRGADRRVLAGLRAAGWRCCSGTEGDGLSARWLDAADLAVRIPMSRGVDSLNVASAAAIACYVLANSG